MFLSQIASQLAGECALVEYINAAVLNATLFTHLGERLNIDSENATHRSVLAALKARGPLILLIDAAESLSNVDSSELKQFLSLYKGERLFYPGLSQVYVVVGTRGMEDEADVHLSYFSRKEVASLLKREVGDRVSLAVYAWSKGSPELTRDLAEALQCRESNVQTVYSAVHNTAAKGKLFHVAKQSPSLEQLRGLGLVNEHRPLPAFSLAKKLLSTQWFGLTICENTMEVRYKGKLVHLFPIEARILCFMAASPGRIYTPAQIYSAVHGCDALYAGESSIKAQMCRLRSKLPHDEEWIVTRRGLGYLFNPYAPCVMLPKK